MKTRVPSVRFNVLAVPLNLRVLDDLQSYRLEE